MVYELGSVYASSRKSSSLGDHAITNIKGCGRPRAPPPGFRHPHHRLVNKLRPVVDGIIQEESQVAPHCPICPLYAIRGVSGRIHGPQKESGNDSSISWSEDPSIPCPPRPGTSVTWRSPVELIERRSEGNAERTVQFPYWSWGIRSGVLDRLEFWLWDTGSGISGLGM